MKVRRVVTGHDADGKAVFASDERGRRLPAVADAGVGVPPPVGRRRGAALPRRRLAPADRPLLPAGGRVPVRVLRRPAGRPSRGGAARATSRARSPSSRPTCPGCRATWSPTRRACTRRTRSTSRSCSRARSGSSSTTASTVHLKAGDTVVQNGTRHAWRNNGTETCRLAVFICGAHHDDRDPSVAGRRAACGSGSAGYRARTRSDADGARCVRCRRHDGLPLIPPTRVDLDRRLSWRALAPRPGVPRHRRDRGVRLGARVHDRARLPLPDRRARQPPARARRHGHGGRGLRASRSRRGSSPTCWSRKWSVVIGHAGIGARAADRGRRAVVRRRARRPGRVGPRLHVHERGDRRLGRRRARRPRPARCCAGSSCGPAGSGRRPRSSPCRCRSCSASTWSLRAPLIVGGCLSLGLAAVARRAMGERALRAGAAQTARRGGRWRRRPRAGVRVIRASHVLLFLTLAMFLAGGASEAYDRYIEKFLLARPRPAGLAGLVGPDVAGRRRLARRPRSASSCRGGSSAATPTSSERPPAALDRRPHRRPGRSPCSCWR